MPYLWEIPQGVPATTPQYTNRVTAILAYASFDGKPRDSKPTINNKMRTILSLLAAILLTSPASAQKTRVACVGDSITFGSGIEEREKFCYPAQLQGLLGEKFEVKNFGVSGTTMLSRGDSPYIRTKQYRAAISYNPDVVVINLGTNDTKPQNWKYKRNYQADYRKMLAIFSKLPSQPRIYVCLPTPVFETKWGIRESVVKEEIIPTLKEMAFDMSLSMIDFYTPLAGKADCFPDKVHPNKEGAAIMARQVSGAIRKSPRPEAIKKKQSKPRKAQPAG